MNKRQITGGKNNSDKIEEKRGNIPTLIKLRFGAQALRLNPKVRKKAERVYYWRMIFSPTVINRYVRDTNILMGALPRYRKAFSLLTFTVIIFSWFLSFIQLKNIVINLVNPNTAVQNPFFWGSIVFVEDLVFEGESLTVNCVDF